MQVPQVDGVTVIDDSLSSSHEASDSDAASAADANSDLSQSDLERSKPPSQSPSAKQLQVDEERQQQHRQHQQQQPETKPDAELQDFQNEQERREDLKQQMAVTASKLLQNPEATLPSMRSLLALAADRDSQVSLLILCACISQPARCRSVPQGILRSSIEVIAGHRLQQQVCSSRQHKHCLPSA